MTPTDRVNGQTKTQRVVHVDVTEDFLVFGEEAANSNKTRTFLQSLARK